MYLSSTTSGETWWSLSLLFEWAEQESIFIFDHWFFYDKPKNLKRSVRDDSGGSIQLKKVFE
jgi:hypothetical protein